MRLGGMTKYEMEDWEGPSFPAIMTNPEPWVEVTLFYLQLNKWINKLAWTFQEFDITLVENRKSQNARKPHLLGNFPCDLLFSYQGILHITKIFNMYFSHCHPGWLYCGVIITYIRIIPEVHVPLKAIPKQERKGKSGWSRSWLIIYKHWSVPYIPFHSVGSIHLFMV